MELDKKRIKALFLLFHGFAPYSGISKKVYYQVAALKECGLDVDICYMTIDEKGFQKRVYGETIIDNYGNGYRAKFIKWYHFATLTDFILNNGIEFIYIRSFYNTNPSLIRMLKKLKNSGVKIVMEIPTYPYDDEFRGSPLKDKLRCYINMIYRNKLKHYISRMVTFTDYPEIHGVKTINISNGIDFDSIRLKSQINDTSIRLNLIGVADIHYWHGFDRVIEGLHDYYRVQQHIEVYFNIVGDGVPSEVNMLRKLVRKYGLNKYIFFFDNCFGEELDRHFDESDFGIASLGRHRSGIKKIKTLKNREYAARGIPFIYSEIDDDFDNMPYVLKASANESHIDIQKIIDFKKSINMSPYKIRASIVDTLSWKVQMQKVINETFSD